MSYPARAEGLVNSTMTYTQTTYPNRVALRVGKKGVCPAEVGALAPLLEKSATKLKLKQKLLKSKSTIQIVIFNVRTFNGIGHIPELTSSAIDHNVDIICMQEHRHNHSEDVEYHDTGNRWAFVSASAWKNSVNAGIWGVGMQRGSRALKSLTSTEKIQPRIMVGTLNSDPSTTIISSYSCTNASEEKDLIAFYNELSSLIRFIPKHNVLVIGEDMNALISKNVNHKLSLHNSSKRNGATSNRFHARK